MYGDLEDEFRRYASIVNDKNTPIEELVIYISHSNDDSINLFKHLGEKFKVKTTIKIEIWNE